MSIVSTIIGTAERVPLPDLVIRAAIQRRCSRTATRLAAHSVSDDTAFAGKMMLRPIAEHADAAIARAADALGLTASAVSRAISRLEARVGGRLLERTTRSLSLTDEGRRFYERVGPHLSGIEEAAIEASGSAGIVRGRLRVNVDPFFSRIVLSSHISCLGVIEKENS